MTWRAYLDESFDHGPLGVRLQLADVHDNSTTFLMEDGTMLQVQEPGLGQRLDEPTGILLPRDPEALRAIAQVFHPHATGQARLEGVVETLTQTLNVEKERVDRMIGTFLNDRR